MALSYKCPFTKLLDSCVIISASIFSDCWEYLKLSSSQDFAMDCNDEANQQHKPDKLEDDV